MKRVMRYILPAGLLALCTACYSYRPPAPPVPSTEIQVRASFARTWDAVIDLFAEQNISIATIERASGIIVATPGYLGEPFEKVVSYADCGSYAKIPYVASRVGYNVRVKGDSSRSTLRVNAVFQSANARALDGCNTKNVWENKIGAMIQQRAEQAR